MFNFIKHNKMYKVCFIQSTDNYFLNEYGRSLLKDALIFVVPNTTIGDDVIEDVKTGFYKYNITKFVFEILSGPFFNIINYIKNNPDLDNCQFVSINSISEPNRLISSPNIYYTQTVDTKIMEKAYSFMKVYASGNSLATIVSSNTTNTILTTQLYIYGSNFGPAYKYPQDTITSLEDTKALSIYIQYPDDLISLFNLLKDLNFTGPIFILFAGIPNNILSILANEIFVIETNISFGMNPVNGISETYYPGNDTAIPCVNITDNWKTLIENKTLARGITDFGINIRNLKP